MTISGSKEVSSLLGSFKASIQLVYMYIASIHKVPIHVHMYTIKRTITHYVHTCFIQTWIMYELP